MSRFSKRIIFAMFFVFLIGTVALWLKKATPIRAIEVPTEETPGMQHACAKLNLTYVPGSVGDSVTINVVVSNVTDLACYEFKVGYNVSLLIATDVAVGDFFSDFFLVQKKIDHTMGCVWLALCMPLGSHRGVNGSGILASISFNVKSPGGCVVTLYDIVMGDSNAQRIPHEGLPVIDLEVEDGYFVGEIHEHDLAVFLEVPNHLEPGDSSVLNATVVNWGLCNETDLQLKLLIDDNLTKSIVVSSLQAGAAYTLDHVWTPTVRKTYNVTAHAMPIIEEDHTSNNVISARVVVRPPIKVPEDYATIREAVESAVSGEIILVASGVYFEQSLTIDKSLTLVGENCSTTIIDGNGAKEVVLYVVADYVNISGFTIRNSFGGVLLTNSNGTNFIGNSIMNSHNSLSLLFCHGSSIIGNTLKNNEYGIALAGSNHNAIHHNNFINTVQVYVLNSTNIWNDGAGEGNYWSNYNGTDLDGDGIGDEYLPWEQVDYYPLMSLVTKVTPI